MENSLHCLIVEDSPEDAVLLVEELRSAGFAPEWRRVETEEEYRTGLNPGLDVIFSDFGLPQFSTSRALGLLREAGLEIPFIIVSGTIGEERAVESLKAGATDYVVKDRLERIGPAVTRARREVTERTERRRAEETLRASEARFRQLADSINEVFWLRNLDGGEMLYVSPAYRTIWCDDTDRMPTEWPARVHPEERVRLAEAIANAPSGAYDETFRIVRPDGSVRWIHDRAFPVRDAGPNVRRIAGVAEDITEQKRLEEQLRQAQKIESIGQLAGGVAHDFNNLLTVIHGHATLMQAETNLPADSLDSLEQIVLATERAAGLTRQLLAFSRKQVLRLQPIRLDEVVNGLNRMLVRLLSEEVHLRAELEPNLPPVEADVGLLEQVLMNLAVNARDAMPRGGDLVIGARVEEIVPDAAARNPQATPGQHVLLSVRDTGCGIPPTALPRIFEPFFTTKEPGKGTGLGLATVYGIVRQHRGWIDVRSEPGVGTEFQIHLPTMRRPVIVRPEPPASTKTLGGKETILLVEDEDALRAVARGLMERIGYTVLEASTGVTALEVWRRHGDKVNLVLTDMVMPDGMNGRDLAEALHQKRPDLPFIFTSGYSDIIAGDEAVWLKDCRFLQKPYTLLKLAAMLREALDQSAAGSGPAKSSE